MQSTVIQHTYSNVWVVNKNYFFHLAFPFQQTIYILSFVVKFVISNGYTRDYYSFFIFELQNLSYKRLFNGAKLLCEI